MKILFRLLGFLRPFVGWVTLSVFLGAMTVLGAVGLMGTSAYLIASAALHPSIADLQVAIVGVRFFGISRGVFRYLERLVTHSVNFRLLEHLRVWFFKTIEPLAPAGLEDQFSGDLLSRSIGDIETLENFYVRAIAPPITAVIVTVGMGLYVGQLSWSLSGILILGLVLSGLGVPWLTRMMSKKSGQELVAAKAKMGAILVESVQGMADLLAFGAEEKQMSGIRLLNDKICSLQSKMGRVTGFTTAVNLLITNLCLLGVLIFSIQLLRDGGMAGVSLAVVSLITISSFEAVVPLGTAAQHLDSSLVAGERILKFESIHTIVQEPVSYRTMTGPVNIRFDEVFFRYRAEAPWALRDMSLDLPAGKHLALIGSSGSGKTSLFNLLQRYWEPQQGSIYINANPIQEYSADEVRSKIGMLSQNPFVFAGTLRENLLLANQASSDGELFEILQTVGLDEWFASLPKGLNTWLGERGFKVSGGERQRISIARTLLRNAPLLLLDEPYANLDYENAQLIHSAIQKHAAGRSMILVSHQYFGLEDFDEILVMQEGAVIDRGKLEALEKRVELMM